MSTEVIPHFREIAVRLDTHLKRMEATPAINTIQSPGLLRRLSLRRFFKPSATYVRGSRLSVVYIAYQMEVLMTKPEAYAYLCWLDGGNSGKFHEMPSQQSVVMQDKPLTELAQAA